jgi:tetratricopeptide (TPR) repeat protein
MHLISGRLLSLDPSHDAAWYELGLLYTISSGISAMLLPTYFTKAYDTSALIMSGMASALASLYSQNSQFEEAIEDLWAACIKTDPSESLKRSMELANLYT